MTQVNSLKDVWLKTLIGFIITVMIIGSTVGFSLINKKVDKEVYIQHEKYQTEQFGEIKDSLQRIEEKLP